MKAAGTRPYGSVNCGISFRFRLLLEKNGCCYLVPSESITRTSSSALTPPIQTQLKRLDEVRGKENESLTTGGETKCNAIDEEYPCCNQPSSVLLGRYS